MDPTVAARAAQRVVALAPYGLGGAAGSCVGGAAGDGAGASLVVAAAVIPAVVQGCACARVAVGGGDGGRDACGDVACGGGGLRGGDRDALAVAPALALARPLGDRRHHLGPPHLRQARCGGGEEDAEGGGGGRGLHLSTFQLSLSRF